MFGATGSVGQSALDLVARDADGYDVVALTGGRNVTQLAADARRLNADLAVTCFPECYNELKDLLADTDVEVAAGPDAIAQAAARPVDWALSAIVGAAGLVPGLEALSHGTTLALAARTISTCCHACFLVIGGAEGRASLPAVAAVALAGATKPGFSFFLMRSRRGDAPAGGGSAPMSSGGGRAGWPSATAPSVASVATSSVRGMPGFPTSGVEKIQ